VIDIARDQYIESMPGLTAVAGALVSEARGTSQDDPACCQAYAPA
jgi:hypothetical protein